MKTTIGNPDPPFSMDSTWMYVEYRLLKYAWLTMDANTQLHIFKFIYR